MTKRKRWHCFRISCSRVGGMQRESKIFHWNPNLHWCIHKQAKQHSWYIALKIFSIYILIIQKSTASTCATLKNTVGKSQLGKGRRFSLAKTKTNRAKLEIGVRFIRPKNTKTGFLRIWLLHDSSWHQWTCSHDSNGSKQKCWHGGYSKHHAPAQIIRLTVMFRGHFICYCLSCPSKLKDL